MPPAGGSRIALSPYVARAQALDAYRYVFEGRSDLEGSGVFSPGMPIPPSPAAAVRLLDFRVGENTFWTPRSSEAVGFEALRGLADGYDICRLAIETRKDQIEKLDWLIKPIEETAPGDGATDRIASLGRFWRKPDGHRPFASWLRESLEDLLVLDAPAFEVRRDGRGEICSLDSIDGATIKLLVDDTGRQPAPPAPAFEQVIKGRPWRLLTRDELIYLPRNPRPHKLYGFSPVEQIAMTVNIALRRQIMQLAHFTEGNTPPGLLNAPDGWGPEQIRQFQEWFDSVLAGNLGNRTRLVWGPSGSKYQAFKEAPVKDEFDEWLARVVCYAFSLPPTAFTRQINRATAETAQEAAVEEGLAPLMRWVKRLVDEVIQDRMGHPDLEFAWKDARAVDPHDQAEIDEIYVRSGIKTINEARAGIGLSPVPGGDVSRLITAAGSMPLIPDVTKEPSGAAGPQQESDGR